MEAGHDSADDEGEQHAEVDESERVRTGSSRSASDQLGSATPWTGGVSHATGCRKPGSWSTGKNVPLNRNSGVIPKRKM